MDYFPLPVPDPACEWGNENCSKCGINKVCYGHFLTPELAIHSTGTSAMVKPPSQVLKEAFTELNGDFTDDDIKRLSKSTLLAPEEVEMWIEHIQVEGGGQKRLQPLEEEKKEVKSNICASVGKNTRT